MKTLRLLLFLLCAAVFQSIAEAGLVDPTKIVWPEAAQNFHTLEYFFDPITQKITVRLWDGSSAIAYSGIKAGVLPGKAPGCYFTVLSKIGGENDPMFKRTADNSWMVSFAAPGFDPRKDQLIYRGENRNDTRSIPYKGGVKEAERARTKKPTK